MIRIEVVPCLEDNYAYIIINNKNEAIVVDVPDAEPINKRIADQGLDLAGVLITHHHHDHIQGLPDLDLGYAPVFGAAHDQHRLPHLGVKVNSGEHIKVARMRFEILPADGHTIGHIAYYLPEANALFSGDSLTYWGCGRLFEGSPEQMWESLERFMELPDDTMIYSGHNYGVANGNFALSLGGYMDRMEARMEKVRGLNAENTPVCPVFLSEEKATNPFLLVVDETYSKEVGVEELSVPERFARLRKLKDDF